MRILERLGEAVIEAIVALGNFMLILLTAAYYAIMPPYKPRLILLQLRAIGAESFFLVALIGIGPIDDAMAFWGTILHERDCLVSFWREPAF